MSKICEDMGISLSLFQEFRQNTRMFKYSSIEGWKNKWVDTNMQKQFNGGNGARKTEHKKKNKTQPKFQSIYKN